MKDYQQQEYYTDPLYKTCNDIYSLFFIGALIGWMTIPFGSFAAFFYMRRCKNQPLFYSHFYFQAICSIWLIISVGISAFAAYYFWLSPHAAINQDNLPLTNSHRVEIAAGFIIWFITLYILWFRRIWLGYRLLSQHKKITKVWTPWMPKG